MKRVYIAADNIISPLGLDTHENLSQVKQGASGIRQLDDRALSKSTFFGSAIHEWPVIQNESQYTRIERLAILSIKNALSKTEIGLTDEKTVFIFSTTKGNIELIEKDGYNQKVKERISLFNTAKIIAGYFQCFNTPVVISNACISGLLSIITAKRLLESGKFEHAIITGADVLSEFVVSGFESLHAMSHEPCRPFDKDRDGINLGECAATVMLTTNSSLASGSNKICVNGGACTNDANHISGPSRTGAELSFAINSAMQQSKVSADALSFVSAHGTATIFNDEMESLAFAASGLSEIPIHSLKGNFGHTLGAAGVLESILSYRSLQEGIVLPSKNFNQSGVSAKVNINTAVVKSNKRHALKTVSGFGGGNAAVVYSIE